MSFEKQFYELIRSKVKIETVKGNYSGYLLCLDPITLTLIIFNDELNQIHLIFEHSVKSITKLNGNKTNQFKDINFQQFCDQFFNIKTNKNNISVENLKKRRQEVWNLLMKNNVPVVESSNDSLIAAYNVTINPPYTANDCSSSNTIVLGKIKSILEKE